MSRALIAALLVVPLVAAAAAAMPQSATFRFDLAAASAKGKPLLGRSPSAVIAALGRPSVQNLRRNYGVIRYGPRSGAVGWPLTITFGRRAGALRAWSVAIASPQATEVRTGKILRLSPRELQRTIARAYAGTFRLVQSYTCRRQPIRCRGAFESVDRKTKISFGRLGPQRYVVIYA